MDELEKYGDFVTSVPRKKLVPVEVEAAKTVSENP
jgi:hypothetical protein